MHYLISKFTGLTLWKRYICTCVAVALLFIVLISVPGYFGIGLLSDDYLNIYDAVHSSLSEKFTGQLPFTNVFHIRPLYYLSLEKTVWFSKILGLDYDNFIIYRIQNLVLLILISFLSGAVVLGISRRLSLGIIGFAAVLLYPNNINNICWTAARADLLCTLFYLASGYLFLSYLKSSSAHKFIFCVISFVMTLLSKEIGITLPFVLLLLAYFTEGRIGVYITRHLLLLLFAILIFYLVIRFVLNPHQLEILTLYQSSPFANIPGVLARGIIALSIPMDFLTLNYALKNHNKIMLLYLFILYGAVFYFIWTMFASNIYRHVGQIAVLSLVALSPYMIVGYIRPQMILLPFCIIIIFTLHVYSHHRYFNVKLNKNVLKIFTAAVMLFWTYWTTGTVSDWSASYEKARTNINNLISENIDPARRNIVIGNPGRFKQTFMFDKLTGAYNFWKEKDFVIKDTIYDIIQSAALQENSVGAKFQIKKLSSDEFEILAAAPKQFFYIEGIDIDKTNSVFKNNDIEVEFTEFNNINKPIRFKLKALNSNADYFLADELGFVKIK